MTKKLWLGRRASGACASLKSLVINLVANGMTKEEILKEYPDLEQDDITESLQYAAW